MNTKRLTRIAFFTAAALVLSYLESLLPPLLMFAPEAKMGLSNIAPLVAMVILGYTDAAAVQLVRCTLGAIITGGVQAMMFSVPAGAVSLLGMMVLYKFAFPKVSLMGISFTGATMHNLTQVMIAGLIYGVNPGAMLPLYLLASVLAGLFVGIVSFFIIKYLPKKLYLAES